MGCGSSKDSGGGEKKGSKKGFADLGGLEGQGADRYLQPAGASTSMAVAGGGAAPGALSAAGPGS
jgi:hypothetical protein